jgi:hypothetical protein
VNNYNVDIERSKAGSCRVVEQVFNSNTALNHELLKLFADEFVARFEGYSDNVKNYDQSIFDGLKNSPVTLATIIKLYKELTKEKPYLGTNNRKDLKAAIGDTNYDALVENLKAYQMSSVGDDSPGGMMKRLINILFDIARRWNDGFHTFQEACYAMQNVINKAESVCRAKAEEYK